MAIINNISMQPNVYACHVLMSFGICSASSALLPVYVIERVSDVTVRRSSVPMSFIIVEFPLTTTSSGVLFIVIQCVHYMYPSPSVVVSNSDSSITIGSSSVDSCL